MFAATPSPASSPTRPAAPPRWPERLANGLFALSTLFYLLPFIVLPLLALLVNGLSLGGSAMPLDSLLLAWSNPTYRAALGNSLLLAGATAAGCCLLALPAAVILLRQPKAFAAWLPLGLLPLCTPPFLAAAALKGALGPGGWAGWLNHPAGLLAVEVVHYFPMLLLAILLPLRQRQQEIDSALLCAPRHGWRFLRRIFLPLALPGLTLGCALIFSRVLDDIATPLILGQSTLLAPLLYLRVGSHGFADPVNSVLALCLLCLTLGAWLLASRPFAPASLFSPLALPPADDERPPLSPGERAYLALLAGLAGLPFIALLLLSFAGLWSFTALPESYTLRHYLATWQTQQGALGNTLLYCGLAALCALLAALIIALRLHSRRTARARRLSNALLGLVALPGSALVIGYQQCYAAFSPVSPFGGELGSAPPWAFIALVLSVRNLPYAVQILRLALANLPAQQLEAAHVLGQTPWRSLVRIALPLLAGSLVTAFAVCFLMAAFDLSTALILIPSENMAPLSYSIYLEMFKTSNQESGAALAVTALALLGLGAALGRQALRRRRPQAVAEPAA